MNKREEQLLHDMLDVYLITVRADPALTPQQRDLEVAGATLCIERLIRESNDAVAAADANLGMCSKCGHSWGEHGGEDGRLPGVPCCMHYIGMGEPCGCDRTPRKN